MPSPILVGVPQSCAFAAVNMASLIGEKPKNEIPFLSFKLVDTGNHCFYS